MAALEDGDPSSSPGTRAVVGVVAGRALIVVSAIAAAIFFYRRAAPRFNDDFWSFLVAIGVPLLLLAGVWLAREGYWEARDHRALGALRRSGRPRPGDWIALTGRAVALEEPLAATLSGRPGLACRYRVRVKRSSFGAGASESGRRLELRSEGYHLVPTGIETEAGTVRLRGFPDLVNLEKSPLNDQQRLTEPAGACPGPAKWRAAARARLLVQPRERLDVDWRYGSDGGAGLPRLEEWVLAPGELVCVFGRRGDGELLPSPRRRRGLPIYAGSPDEVLAMTGGGSKVFFVLAGLAITAATGLATWVLV